MTKLKNDILNLIHECQYCITVIRLDYNDSAWKSVSTIITLLSDFIKDVQLELGEDHALKIADGLGPFLPDLMDAQKKRDLCRIADVIELSVMGFLRNTSGIYCDEMEPCAVRQMVFDYNEVGEVILGYIDDDGKRALTGQAHPFLDAVQFFFEMREDVRTYYALAGGCMIYEALAIMRIQIDTKVYIIEENAEVVNALKRLFNIDEYIMNGRICFVTGDAIDGIGKYLREQTLLVKPSSIICATSERLKYAYNQYRMILLSHMEESYLLFKNFQENCVDSTYECISDYAQLFRGKQVYIVAGGPSLGKCYQILKNRNNDNSVILCVGTSAGRLIKEGINPEFVIISDPLPTMEKQLDQPFDYGKTALIYASTAYGGAVRNFKGRKYVAFQKDFEMSEKEASNNGTTLYETGGSVSTIALDIALRSMAKEIVCLGLDLAYTNNEMHVLGVDDDNEADKNVSMEMVKSVSGDMVPTVQNLNSYRKWIVERLKRYKGDARVVNISDGAYIEGMENIPTEGDE